MTTPFCYEELPAFDAFEQVSQPGIYTPLPDDWLLGATDVVRSTDALRSGRYKAVNMAGASVVSAVMNAVGHSSFPFVFGGDGAILAVGPADADAAREAMARTVRFVDEDLGLTLRAGLMRLHDIRAAGHDVRVARYAASPQAVYAMFSGGGCSFVEGELKAGRLALTPAAPGERPDLAGLSCRWSPIKAQRGVMLSLLALPAQDAAPERFQEVAAAVIRTIQREDRDGHPVLPSGPEFALNPQALRMEAKATRRGKERVAIRAAKAGAEMLVGKLSDRIGRAIGGFDAKRYRSWVARNTDFRKFEDGLRMTVDCSRETADALEALLARAEAERIVDYGLHRQDAALMTCVVPSPFQDDHMHFLDGAGGGYARSAEALKARLEQRAKPSPAH